MRIVTWNCNGALRRKLDSLAALDADVYVIQECEDPSRSSDGRYAQWGAGGLWVGEGKNRGLGVFAALTARIDPLPWDSSGLQFFIPFATAADCTVLAVWAHGTHSPTFAYIGQLWKYLQLHEAAFPRERFLVCGDLNSNARWDVWDRWWNHSDVVCELGDLGIRSLYHHQTGEEQGAEDTPTFFMHRRRERGYHIDYAFLSEDLLATARLEVGKADEWLSVSDHLPLVIDVVA